MNILNITIDTYVTRNFDISPEARIAFGNLAYSLAQDSNSLERLASAAEHLDKALDVVKKAKEKSLADSNDLDEFNVHAMQAEDILDEVDSLDNHDYIRDYHEAELMDLYEIDVSELEGLEGEDEVDDEYDDDFSEFDDEDDLDEDDLDEDDLDDEDDIDESVLVEWPVE